MTLSQPSRCPTTIRPGADAREPQRQARLRPPAGVRRRGGGTYARWLVGAHAPVFEMRCPTAACTPRRSSLRDHRRRLRRCPPVRWGGELRHPLHNFFGTQAGRAAAARPLPARRPHTRHADREQLRKYGSRRGRHPVILWRRSHGARGNTMTDPPTKPAPRRFLPSRPTAISPPRRRRGDRAHGVSGEAPS